MLVACDVDGVIANLHDAWYARYNQDYNDDLTIGRVRSWNTHLYVKEACGKKIYDYLKQPDLYDAVVPMPGAQQGIKAIRSLGHEVVFVTSNTYGMTDQKARWLERYGFVETTMDEQLPHDLMITYNKRRCGADVLIDDRGETIKDWVSTSMRRAILVTYPHNESLDLHSAQWQRVSRAAAYPEPSELWLHITHLFANGDV